MITRIAKGAAAATFGLALTATPMLSGSAEAKVAPGGPESAYSYEWNNAVKSAAPTGAYYCAHTTGSLACFKPDGDHIYVKDTKADGYSAVMRWYTDYGRWGTCRNALKAGTWGVCNKDFAEKPHTLYFRATRYNGTTGKWVSPESLEASVSTWR